MKDLKVTIGIDATIKKLKYVREICLTGVRNVIDFD